MRALIAVGTLLLTGCSSDIKPKSEGSADPPGLSASDDVKNCDPTDGWDPTRGLDLKDPNEIRSRNGVLNATLDVQTRDINVSGATLKARNFNGHLIGPTMRVRPGDQINVDFVNGMDQATNIHYHGLHVSPLGESDNVFRSFAPGSTSTSSVTLPSTHEVGTFWYHVHFHGLSNNQVAGGLSGLLIIDGIEDKLAAFPGIVQRQLAIRDVTTKDGAIVLDGSDGEVTRLVNGQCEPRLSIKQGETQLWRIANIGANLFYDVELRGHTFAVLAEDGNLAWDVRTMASLPLPPGKRYDVLVRAGQPGQYELGTKDIPTAPDPHTKAVLGRLTVTPGDGRSPAPLPTSMADKARLDLSGATPTAKRDFKFSFGRDDKGKFIALINDKAYNISDRPVGVQLGSTEEWTLVNASEDPHPFHIHVNNFQVMKINGQDALAASLADVVTIPAGTDCDSAGMDAGKCQPSTVVIRQRYDDFHGWFVFHCHILFHEDRGMMKNIQVLRPDDALRPPPHDPQLTPKDH